MPRKIKKRSNDSKKKQKADQTPQQASPLQAAFQRIAEPAGKGEKAGKENNQPQRPKPKFRLKHALMLLPAVLLLALMIFIKVNDQYKLVMQTDYSVKFTFAYQDNKDRVPHKDQYIAFYFKALPNDPKYGKQFVKRVACMPGDELRNSGRDFYCNSQYIGTAKTHSRTGKPAPLFTYSGRIPEGTFFATGDTRDSYDSKYWGLVSDQWVIGNVRKII